MTLKHRVSNLPPISSNAVECGWYWSLLVLSLTNSKENNDVYLSGIQRFCRVREIGHVSLLVIHESWIMTRMQHTYYCLNDQNSRTMLPEKILIWKSATHSLCNKKPFVNTFTIARGSCLQVVSTVKLDKISHIWTFVSLEMFTQEETVCLYGINYTV